MSDQERKGRLRGYLATPGVTYDAVANAAGVSKTLVSFQANGQRRVSDRVLAAAEQVARRAVAGRLQAYALDLVGGGV